MAIYVGAGGVKTPTAIYVGAGGVKTVSAVYVGVGSVKQVWPAALYDGGTIGGGYTMVTSSSTSSVYPVATSESGYIKIYKNTSGSIHADIAGVYFTPKMDVSSYKTITATYIVTQTLTSLYTPVYVYLGGCTSTPTWRYTTGLYPQGTDYCNTATFDSTTTTNTSYNVSFDVSSISTSLYIYVGANESASYSGLGHTWEVHITKIEMS